MELTIRRSKERVRKTWMQIMLVVILLLPVFIGGSLIYKSVPLLSLAGITDILFGTEWMPLNGKFGLWPFLYSSLLVSLLGLVLMVPISLAVALYITQFAQQWIKKVLRSVIDILAGIPSVIFGLWGVITIVPLVSDLALLIGMDNASGYSIFAAAIVVSISVMPFVLNMLIELFESVPVELKEAVLSMGASYWQAVKEVVLKKTRPGVVAAFSLGISKAFGETIAVLMVVGNVVHIPSGIFDAGYPLPALLANNYGEMMSIPMYDAALMFSALVLLIVVAGFNYLAHQIIKYYNLKA